MSRRDASLPQPLRQALREGDLEVWLGRLAASYDRLPSTVCQRRGACCGLLPPAHPLEMLAWLGELCRMDEEARGKEAQSLVEHFLQNACLRLACPWSRGDSCARYERRFFGCRAYGLWSPAVYAQRRDQSLQAAQAVQAAWENLGLRLPAEVCAGPPDYCRQVRPVSGPRVDDAALEALEAGLAALGGERAWHPLLADAGGDLGYLTAGLALGWRDCLREKVAFTRAFLKGRAQEAEACLARAQKRTRSWALALA